MSQGLLSIPNHNLPRDDSLSIFSLKRCHSSPSAPSILVNYSHLPHPQSTQQSSSVNLIPQFNNDKKFYTPSFILSSQIGKFIANDAGYRMIHEKKIQQMEQEDQDILVPKPSRANSYCCVCREPFQDYLTHLAVSKHQQLMRKSPFYTLIEELCEKNGQTISNCPLRRVNRKAKNDGKRQLLVVEKKKKIVKVQCPDQPQRKRGRPRKEVGQAKLEMLASIPTSVSISL